MTQPVISAISRRAKLLVVLSAAGALMPQLASLPSDDRPTLAWALDLVAHWQWVYLIIGGLCVTWFVALGVYGWALPALFMLAAGWWLSSPESYAAASSRADMVLTVVTANINADNHDSSALRQWVESLDADIVVIQEVTPATKAALEQWDAYPHRAIAAQEGPFGLAVLSRHALDAVESREPGGQTLHYRVHLRWAERLLALSAVHPMPPVTAEYHTRRVELFESESRWAKDAGLPALVVGDFNATPWSSAMRSFAAHGQRSVTGFTPTWPAPFPLIPIDQVVASDHWRVVDGGVGPRTGSDHRPVYVRLALASAAND